MKRPAAIPLADGAELRAAARRTAVVRSVFVALAALAVTGICIVASGGAAHAAGARRAATVVVLDVSGSITGADSAAIRRVLAAVRDGADGRPVGLVLFSDTALEVLPPTAPAAALDTYRRFFVPLRGRGPRPPAPQPSAEALVQTVPTNGPRYPTNPWSIPFSGGTSISTGLHEARADLRRAHERGGDVVLVSDLVDSPQDQRNLNRELLAYTRDPRLRLQVRALPGFVRPTLASYRRLLGRRAAEPAAVAPAPQREVVPHRPLPGALLALTALAAVALALYELVCVPLRWRSRAGEAAA